MSQRSEACPAGDRVREVAVLAVTAGVGRLRGAGDEAATLKRQGRAPATFANGRKAMLWDASRSPNGAGRKGAVKDRGGGHWRIRGTRRCPERQSDPRMSWDAEPGWRLMFLVPRRRPDRSDPVVAERAPGSIAGNQPARLGSQLQNYRSRSAAGAASGRRVGERALTAPTAPLPQQRR